MSAPPRFHCPMTLVAGSRVSLPADVVHHAIRVRRLRVGDDLVLFAGDGREARGRLVTIERDDVVVEVRSVETVNRESPLRITLLQGVSSGDRMDYTLQKAVELGCISIVPVLTERSIVRLDGERAEKRVARWQQVVIGACEQCGRDRIPDVRALTDLRSAVQAVANADRRFMLSLDGGQRLRDIAAGDSIALLAGPEGGLAADEERVAKKAGFVALSLGPRVLRTETAAVAALAAMQALWGDG